MADGPKTTGEIMSGDDSHMVEVRCARRCGATVRVLAVLAERVKQWNTSRRHRGETALSIEDCILCQPCSLKWREEQAERSAAERERAVEAARRTWKPPPVKGRAKGVTVTAYDDSEIDKEPF